MSDGPTSTHATTAPPPTQSSLRSAPGPDVPFTPVATRDAAALWPERFQLIDGWRGLAALAVVIHHVTGTILIGGPAVLLFFVISGYCIAASAATA